MRGRVVVGVNDSVKVDVWSDIACPWCYIGKRKFESGVAAFAASGDARPVEVEYHSFELSPDTPVDFEGTRPSSSPATRACRSSRRSRCSTT